MRAALLCLLTAACSAPTAPEGTVPVEAENRASFPLVVEGGHTKLTLDEGTSVDTVVAQESWWRVKSGSLVLRVPTAEEDTRLMVCASWERLGVWTLPTGPASCGEYLGA